MPREFESPSSINLYYQCPRRYYYQYILKLATKPSIHLIRGNVVHSACERFYDNSLLSFDASKIMDLMHDRAESIFEEEWKNAFPKLSELEMPFDELDFFYEESKRMMQNFARYNWRLMTSLVRNVGGAENYEDAWEKIKPKVEEEIRCSEYGIRGFIDVINNDLILDYKTSKNDVMSDSYERQLSLYALMHETVFGSRPSQVGILFLKFDQDPILLEVDENMIKTAKVVCETIKSGTATEDMNEYPCKESGLCKWATGQCDFYERCLNDKMFER